MSRVPRVFVQRDHPRSRDLPQGGLRHPRDAQRLRLDCPDDEPEELRALQREHLKRIVAGDRLWMPFRSLDDLSAQVRVMRFDPDSLARGVTTRLAVLLLAELVGMESDRERRGEMAWVRDVIQPFQDLLQGVVKRWGGAVQAETPTEYELSFETADAAVTAALALHQAVREHDWHGPAPGLRLGVHVGQVVRFGGVDESRMLQVSARRWTSAGR